MAAPQKDHIDVERSRRAGYPKPAPPPKKKEKQTITRQFWCVLVLPAAALSLRAVWGVAQQWLSEH